MATAISPYRYRIYGLTVASDFELPDLPAAGTEQPTIEIVRTRVDNPLPVSAGATGFSDRGTEQFLVWQTVGCFRIVSNTRIEVDPAPDVPDRLVALPLLGTVLASLLHRRGLYVLHASAVAVDGKAVALLGDKGAGKSTTAAAMIAGGHSLLADDVVAVDFSDPEAPLILSAFGQLKLWADASASLPQFGQRDRGRLYGGLDKSSFGLDRGFATEAAAASRYYLLQRSEHPGVGSVSPDDAMAALIRFSYMGRYGTAGFGAGMASHFLRSGELAQSGRVRVLRVPIGLDRIGKIPDLVATDLADQT